jgi:hypothetical protein
VRFHTCTMNIFLKVKHQALLVFLVICMCLKSAINILLLFVVLSWISVLWIVKIMLEICKKGATVRC